MSGSPDYENQNQEHELIKKIKVESRIIERFSQLDRIEKERVILAFREGSIKGFDISGLPIFIYSKTNILISEKFVNKIRQFELVDSRKWYITMAKDQYAYIHVYRKCIDELEQVRKECWRLIMDKRIDGGTKVQALREIHNVVKTQILLIRDLPFVMNLSKYYDPKLIKPQEKHKTPLEQLSTSNDRTNNPHKQHPLNSYLHKTIYNSVNQNHPVSLPHKVLDEADAIRSNLTKNVDDDIMESIANQNNPLSQADKDAIELEDKQDKEIQDSKLKNVISQYEQDLRDEFKANNGKLEVAKVLDLQDKAEQSINYLESVMTDEEKETIKRLREISD